MLRRQMCPYFVVLILAAIIGSCKHKNSTPSVDIVLRGKSRIPDKEARSIFDKGLGFIEQGDYSSARKCFFEANRRCPNIPEILNGIGSSFSQTGNPALGNTYFERALSIDSLYIMSYVNLGASLNSMMEFENAKRIFRLGLSRANVDSFNRSILFLDLANSYFLTRIYDSALVFIDSAKANSGHGKVYNMALQAQREIIRKAPIPARQY